MGETVGPPIAICSFAMVWFEEWTGLTEGPSWAISGRFMGAHSS